MANRVTNQEVADILVETPSNVTDLAEFITLGNLVVTQQLSGEGISDTELKEIERWLSAHLYASTKGQMLMQEKTLDVAVTYVGRTGLGLDATTYGQHARLLDTTGKLAGLGKGQAEIKAITSF